MKVVVLLASVVDPKWQLDRLRLRPGTEQAEETGLPRRLSPFDEAALEVALKLRDADAAIRVTTVLPGDATSDALLRGIVALRPHRAVRFDTANVVPWDSVDLARLLCAAVEALGGADLVLTGREFGDADDGVLPPLLAEQQGRQFCGLAHAVILEDGQLIAQRMRGPREEFLRLALPALVSITNDRGNRLRHPLMKNIVLAKREPVEVIAPAAMLLRQVAARSLAVVPPPPRGAGVCRVLSGPLETQVAELATYLRGFREGAPR